jgi:hypothetical protein
VAAQPAGTVLPSLMATLMQRRPATRFRIRETRACYRLDCRQPRHVDEALKEKNVSKGMDQKKNTKKEPQKTMKEKRAAKKEKKK